MQMFELSHVSQKEGICFKDNDVLLIADEKDKKFRIFKLLKIRYRSTNPCRNQAYSQKLPTHGTRRHWPGEYPMGYISIQYSVGSAPSV